MTEQTFRLKQGLRLPLAGNPEQVVYQGPSVRSVALVGEDYHGMKPTMHVSVGDEVKIGQALFEDKKNPGVVYTSPVAGKVSEIHRGARRVLQSVVVECKPQDDAEKGRDQVVFSHQIEGWSGGELSGEKLKALLIESGLWTAFRTRPFSKVPAIGEVPQAIFVNAMDSNPLAADPAAVLRPHQSDDRARPDYRRWFELGLQGLTHLADALEQPKLYLSKANHADIPACQGFTVAQFEGPHPAGLVGTHIHYLYPVSQSRKVWHISYQDVIALGHLLATGCLWNKRVVALAGPQVENPRLIETFLGASIDDITAGQLKTGETRCLSGSVFAGRHAKGPFAYLGRYHLQVSVIAEGRERHFMEYLWPGFSKHSATGVFMSRFCAPKSLDLTSSTNGSERAMVPVGAYERVMPLDILPTQLLRSLIVSDTEMAQALGCLELDEEDLALCTYVCPGKYEYGPLLRKNLTDIEREG